MIDRDPFLFRLQIDPFTRMEKTDQLLSARSGWKGTGGFPYAGQATLGESIQSNWKWSSEGRRGSGAVNRHDVNRKSGIGS